MSIAEHGEKLFNREKLDILCDGQETDAGQLHGELIGMYLEDALYLVDALRRELAQKNASNLCQLAHSLKGSSGNLGAERLAAICQVLETRTRARRLDGATALVDRLELEFLELKKLLTDGKCR